MELECELILECWFLRSCVVYYIYLNIIFFGGILIFFIIYLKFFFKNVNVDLKYDKNVNN